MENIILETFKKLSYYDNKLTLTENVDLINENAISDFFKEMKSLFGNETAFKNEIATLTIDIKDANGIKMSADEIISSLRIGTLGAKEYKKLMMSLFRESTNVIIKDGVAKQIVLNVKTAALFETLTKLEIINRLQSAKNGYTKAESEYLFKIYKNNGGKYVKPVTPIIPKEDTHVNLPPKEIKCGCKSFTKESVLIPSLP